MHDASCINDAWINVSLTATTSCQLLHGNYFTTTTSRLLLLSNYLLHVNYFTATTSCQLLHGYYFTATTSCQLSGKLDGMRVCFLNII